MQEKIKAKRKPVIKIGATDHAKLVSFAEAMESRNPEVAEELMLELERAKVVADGSLPADVVQMGSTVTYKPDTGETRTVTLVFPGDADIAQGKISILTPIGTALIGLGTGQAIAWTARDGRTHQLEIVEVRQPAPAGA
ncbi:nucleoside diphosphate kinase regulator [Pseudaminobacter soli (ex Li et al. 2025)]|uniref:Nucleoside diphosphate kinase regulator n=1 Tax=Pseudaminobacter soli (ex Li et al. 2025) TaxID=1295366 RepID=A0A2P7RZM2_9HYPH|nr:nucleoside diphosphate kinase regulator [Mesorhizobium soli]PSJ55632.1 nucleoside diphosphate kinase regulator [Mesorhizobium soli]